MGLCSRRRKKLLVLFLLLIPNLAAQTEPTVGGIALDPSLHVRRRTPSLHSIIARSKPTAVWSDTDMLWIDRDTSGHPLFALNHAYQLDTADAHGSWALFDADPGYVAAGFVDYTREVTPGRVLATDHYRGAVYLLEWTSHHSTGAGPIDSTRHVFVLHTPANQWRLIGEGPGSADARSENKQTTTTTRYEVQWTKDPAAPVIIRASRLTRIVFHSEVQQAAFDSNHDFILRGALPARFQTASDDYLIAAYADTPRELALRLATCGTFYPLERTASLRDKMLKSVSDSLAVLNPQLPRRLRPGSHITLPDLSSLWDNANHAAGVRNHPSH
ncbi:MAG TPA: hypothetical protein VIM11_12305 [Tepidisphaeraceae bacterium]|jgi:hypothetical protein